MEEKNYNISLFKPNSEFSKVNNRLVITLVLIWAVAIYGFHFFMRAIEKPVPEEVLVTYNAVSDKVNNGTASVQEKQQYVYSLLSVCGKRVKAEEKVVLSKAVTSVVFDLAAGQKQEIIAGVKEIANKKSEIAGLSLDDFSQKRGEVAKHEVEFLSTFSGKLNLKANELRAKLLPLILVTDGSEKIDKTSIEPIMNKYLIHNRSFLTDTIFLGFPFHYFYTAVFLMILFVVLCWIYAYRVEQINKRFGISD